MTTPDHPTHHFVRLEDRDLAAILSLDPEAASVDQLKQYVTATQSRISDSLETW